MSLKVFRRDKPNGAEEAPTHITTENAKQGKVAEGKVHAAFRELYKRYPMRWQKITDSGVARSVIGAVESDFMLVIESGTPGCPYSFVIEVKSSRVHESFADGFKKLIRPAQLAKMRLAERAGQIGVYVFFSTRTGVIEVWPAKAVFAKYYERAGELGFPAYRITAKTLPKFAENVVKAPEEFRLTLIRKS